MDRMIIFPVDRHLVSLPAELICIHTDAGHLQASNPEILSILSKNW